jgi:mitochondrial fission protein ELM1
VIAAGRRTAPVALWIQAQSLGRTRLVQLGRKGGDAAERFDVVATPAYCRLLPHPRRVETCAPLHSLSVERIAQAREHWRARFSAFAAPRIAVLVGGSSGQYWMDAAQAGSLGAEVAALARALGGSVLATTSRRTPRAATEAFCAALGPEAFVHRASDPGENPYPGLLAWADAIVVTADSESMLAETASTGKPIWIHPLAERASFRLLRWPRDLVRARAEARPAGPRGTPRPQRGLERLCGRLIERGLVRPTRDLRLLHEDLARRGLARPFADAAPAAREILAREARAPAGASEASSAAAGREPLRDAQLVAERVRSMLGLPGPGETPRDDRPRGGSAV